MIQISDKKKCCGCTACFNICPRSAIEMQPDSEGFLYPQVDREKCINCGLCESVCPILHTNEHKEQTEGYIVRYREADIVNESTSGGAFTAFATQMLEKGASVYGVGYDDKMKVVHKVAHCTDELSEMRGSKFVQSDLGTAFKEIKDNLEQGVAIMFTGTPCQIAGLCSFLRKDYDNLICMDFVCRGVPSPGLWKNYVSMMERKYSSKMVGARFKNKTYGYHTTTMKVDFENGKSYYGSGRVDPFMKAFVKEMSSRPSCSECEFKGIERQSDITVFDCYEYSKITGRKDDDRGYSSVFIHTSKGKALFDGVKDSLDWMPVEVCDLVTENGIMVKNSAKPNEKRELFYEKASTCSIDEAMQQVNPITKADLCIEKIKGFLYKTGLIKIARKLKKDNIEVS